MIPSDNPGTPVIDARGLKCPWPVLRAARAMRGATHIVLLADDPVARIDVPALALAHGWQIDAEDGDAHQTYRLYKSSNTGSR